MSLVSQAELPQQRSPVRNHVAHAWVTKEIYELIAAEARRRGTHPDRIVAELVTIAAGDADLLESMLGEPRG